MRALFEAHYSRGVATRPKAHIHGFQSGQQEVGLRKAYPETVTDKFTLLLRAALLPAL